MPPLVSLWLMAGTLVTPLCGTAFACGCNWPWNGLFFGCNAIVAEGPPPHCPWCIHPTAAALAMGVSLAAGSLVVWHLPASPRLRFAVGLATTLAGFTVGAALTGLATDHPWLFGIPLG